LSNSEPLSQQKINLETSRIHWAELERHFAAGRVISVDGTLDLIAVADAFGNDDAATTKAWLEQGNVAAVSDAQARRWHKSNASLWAVVVKPWVLVQELAEPH
jgi:hypothetical protein